MTSYRCQTYIDRYNKGVCLVYDSACKNPHVPSCPVVDIRLNGDCIKYACYPVENKVEPTTTTTIPPEVHSMYSDVPVLGPKEDPVQEDVESTFNALLLIAVITFALISFFVLVVLFWKCIGCKRIRVCFQRRESLGSTIHPPFHSTQINLNISNTNSSSNTTSDDAYVTAVDETTRPPNYSSVFQGEPHLYPTLPDESAV